MLKGHLREMEEKCDSEILKIAAARQEVRNLDTDSDINDFFDVVAAGQSSTTKVEILSKNSKFNDSSTSDENFNI